MPHAAPRIVSLLASATEMVAALGLEDRLVGVSHECDHPPSVATLPRVTSTRIDSLAGSGDIDAQVRAAVAAGEPLYDLDAAAIERLAPDLILTQAQCDVCAVRLADVENMLRERTALSATKIVTLNPKSLEDVSRDLALVAEAAGQGDLAARRVTEWRERVDTLRRRAAVMPARPRVAFIEWTDPVMLGGNWIPELIDIAHGQQPLPIDGGQSPYIAWEEVLAYDPEVIVVAPCGFDLSRALREAEALCARPGWNQLSAVRAARVFAADGNSHFNRAGPRLVDSLEILFELIHATDADSPPPAAARHQPRNR